MRRELQAALQLATDEALHPLAQLAGIGALAAEYCDSDISAITNANAWSGRDLVSRALLTIESDEVEAVPGSVPIKYHDLLWHSRPRLELPFRSFSFIIGDYDSTLHVTHRDSLNPSSPYDDYAADFVQVFRDPVIKAVGL